MPGDSTRDSTMSEGGVSGHTSLPDVDAARYAVEGELGEGGLGRVMRAYDRRLNRPVAIKLLRKLSAENEVRFFLEAQTTARLEHPSIVPVHDVGRWQTGEPFFAMKLVSGESLKEVLAKAGTLQTRLPLLAHVLAVCDAVAYAHSAGVIHRDLKPSNVMVGPFGETLVIDWGLAMDGTEVGGPAIVGTPHYMPPEQARGQTVDARSDVYALGAMLYEVLGGRPPYSTTDTSSVLQQIELGPPPPLRARAPDVPDDLLAIVDKAMQRAPPDRYPDARALGADLRRFLSGQWVGAYQYSGWERLRRRLARNKLAAGVIVASLTALALTGALSVSRVVKERDLAESRETQLLYSQARLWLEKDPTAAMAWLKAYAAQPTASAVSTSVVATDAVSRGVAAQLVRGRRTAALGPDGVTLVGAEGDALVRWSTTDATAHSLGAAHGKVSAVAFAADGRSVFCAEGNGLVQRPLDAGPAQTVFEADEPLRAVLVRGELILVGGEQGNTWLRRGAGAFEPLGKLPAVVRSFVLSADAATALVVDVDYGWELVSLATRQVMLRGQGSTGGPALARDGSAVAWIDGATATLVVKPLPDGAERRFEHEHESVVNGLVFSPDGHSLVSLGQDRAVVLRNLDTGEHRALGTHENWAMRAVFSRDGKWLASLGTDHLVKLWQLATGDSWSLRGHNASLRLLEFSADTSQLITSDSEGEVRVWNVPQGAERVLNDAHTTDYIEARYLPDGRFASGGEDGILDVWTPSTGAHTALHEAAAGGSLALSRDWLAHAGDKLFLHPLKALDAPKTVDIAGVHQIAIDPSGTHVAVSSSDHAIRLVGLPSGDVKVVGSHDAGAWHVAYSPDGRWLASTGDDLPVRLWPMAGGAPRVLHGPEGLIYDLQFSADGSWLAAVGVDARIHLWRLPDFRYEARPGHAGLVWQVAFSHDSRTLASASVDGTARLWPLAGGAPLVLRNGSSLARVMYGPDDSTVVTAADDGSLSLWSTVDGARLRVARGHRALPTSLAVSPDGTALGTASEDHTVREWPGFFAAPARLGSVEALRALTSVTLVDDQPLSNALP